MIQISNKLTVTFCSLTMILLASLITFGQVGCVQDDGDTLGHLPQGQTVYYHFVGIQGTQKDQIVDAFNTWRASNTSASTPRNCSGVYFLEGFAAAGSGLVDIEVSNSSLGSASNYDTNYNTPSFAITSAKIYFDLNYRISYPDGSTQLYYDSTKSGYDSVFKKMALHEIGHLMGLSHYTRDHPDACQSSNDQSKYQLKYGSVMNDGCNPNDAGPNPNVVDGNIPPTATPNCDVGNRISAIYPCSTGGGGGGSGPSNPGTGCGVPTYGPNPYGCPYISPLLLDIEGNGFAMTDYYQGVPFDIGNTGTASQHSWTAAGSDDAWVVLDRNRNGTIDNGTEMFGDASEQPIVPQDQRNGFSSLAVFDQPQNAGNGDGKINKLDRIYEDLRLWRDVNHNGVSELNELFRLRELDVRAIFLDYKETKRTDQYGNRFRFKARVRDSRDADVGKFAWDVFLMNSPPNQSQ